MKTQQATEQALNFIDFYNRAKTDVYSLWEFWVVTKDFNCIDKVKILGEVERILKIQDFKQKQANDRE